MYISKNLSTLDFCVGKPQWNPYPGDCVKHITCVEGVAYVRSCPIGLMWDNGIRACNFKYLVSCDDDLGKYTSIHII